MESGRLLTDSSLKHCSGQPRGHEHKTRHGHVFGVYAKDICRAGERPRTLGRLASEYRMLCHGLIGPSRSCRRCSSWRHGGQGGGPDDDDDATQYSVQHNDDEQHAALLQEFYRRPRATSAPSLVLDLAATCLLGDKPSSPLSLSLLYILVACIFLLPFPSFQEPNDVSARTVLRGGS